MSFNFQFAEGFLVLFCSLGRLVPWFAVCVVFDVFSCFLGSVVDLFLAVLRAGVVVLFVVVVCVLFSV